MSYHNTRYIDIKTPPSINLPTENQPRWYLDA